MSFTPAEGLAAKLDPTLAGQAPYLGDFVRETARPLHDSALASMRKAVDVLNVAATRLAETEAQREFYKESKITEVMTSYRAAAGAALVDHRKALAEARAQIREARAETQPPRIVAREFLRKPKEAAAALQLVAMLPPIELATAARDAVARKEWTVLAAIFAHATKDASVPESVVESVSTIFTETIAPGRQMLEALVGAVEVAHNHVEYAADHVAAYPDDPDPVRLLSRANGVDMPYALDPSVDAFTDAAATRAMLEQANDPDTPETDDE
jgi:hypothetical protein